MSVDRLSFSADKCKYLVSELDWGTEPVLRVPTVRRRRTVVTIARYSRVGRDRHQGPLRGCTVQTDALVRSRRLDGSHGPQRANASVLRSGIAPSPARVALELAGLELLQGGV
jgi:hypothetical protein